MDCQQQSLRLSPILIGRLSVLLVMAICRWDWLNSAQLFSMVLEW
jgi:hypothetical protein